MSIITFYNLPLNREHMFFRPSNVLLYDKILKQPSEIEVLIGDEFRKLNG